MFLSGKDKKAKVTCLGCPISQDEEKIRWIIGCFKKIEICIDWENPQVDFSDVITLADVS